MCGGLELWIRNWGVQDSYPESQQEDINDRIVHIQQKFKSLFETQLQEIQEVLQSAEGNQAEGMSLRQLLRWGKNGHL